MVSRVAFTAISEDDGRLRNAVSGHDETISDDRGRPAKTRTVISLYLKFFLPLLLIAAPYPGAEAQEWTKLKEKTHQILLQGQTAEIVIRPEVRFTDGPNNVIIVELRAYARLDDLQDKAPALLQALAAQRSNCETRWNFPSLATTVQNEKLKVGGQLRVVQWACIGPLKTIIASETADFLVALHPVSDGNRVFLKSEIEKFDLGGGLLNSLGAGDTIRNILADLLKRTVGEDTKLEIPPEFATINPTFTNAGIRDTGNNRGELVVEANATIGAKDLTRIMSLIAK